MSWTDQRIDQLKTLWEKGLTASQIAEELGGVSRNAVIGKAHRLGLKSRPSPVKANEPEKKTGLKKTPAPAAASPQTMEQAKAFWKSMPDLAAAKSGSIHQVTDADVLLPGFNVIRTAERFAAILNGAPTTQPASRPN